MSGLPNNNFQELFQYLDEDEDGFITRDELEKATGFSSWVWKL